jgi:2-keto-4-pentenoate hydratase/2-oxohepta-3-ene-1,7-dioic acid hydratase in catechol pathway
VLQSATMDSHTRKDTIVKLVTYKKLDGRLEVGELIDEDLYSLGSNLTMREIAGEESLPTRDESFKVMKHNGIAAPLMPSKILAVGRNYAEHAAELKNEVPDKPMIFAKYPTCVIGDGDAIQWKESVTQQVDWEGELCVVIGKTAKFISEAEAYDHIFGYTIANDVSARDLQDSEKQWTRAKGHDTFCPLGPTIVTKDEIADPHKLRIITKVNGETMQDGSTADMIFKIPYLVSYLSQTFTLEPGDLILTGTPSGVGKAQKPPRFLKDGDEVSITIEGIGTISNPCQILS